MSEIDTIKQASKAITEKQLNQGYQSSGLYPYTDTNGNILYVRLRMDNTSGDKWIRPLSRDDLGNWTQLKEPTFTDGKPLYNLHLIANNPEKLVYLVEGEKCADTLTKLGLIATTSGGATSAKDANWQILTGREVIIWPDNDSAGLQYANEVITKLESLCAVIKLIDVGLLNLPLKGDCVDWLEQFAKFYGRNPMKHDIEALQTKCDLHEKTPGDGLSIKDKKLPNNRSDYLNLVCASDVITKPIDWLWNGWLAKGKLHIFAGAAGTGKTTIAIALAAKITTGGRFPDGSKSPVGNVLIWSGEDSIEDTLVPRLIAAGADLSKVHFVGDTLANNELRGFDPAIDMQLLMSRAAEITDLALLIIDPIVNAVAGDSHKNGEVRRALQPVVDFAERLNCAVLGITHFSKGGQGKDPLERVTGSLAFGALARIVLATAKITDGDNTRRIVCRAKSNVGPDSGGFEYDLQQKELNDGIFSSYALWGDSVEGSARELLAEPDLRETGSNNSNAVEDAKEFLLNLLSNGELSHKQIKVDAKCAGQAWRTVERAKKALNICSSKSKSDGSWYWKLGSNSANHDVDRQESHINSVAVLADLPQIEHISTKNSIFGNENYDFGF